MSVVAGAKSDVGRLREANEDAYLANDALFVVADGMGGHLAGDVASSTAIEVIKSKTRPAGEEASDIAGLLRTANSTIWDKAQSDPSLSGMGTTCTLLTLADTRARIAHVGDSRAYMFRDGELSQLTEDHTLVGRLVKEGRLRPEDAEHHPQRSIITRALGVDEDVIVDTMTLDVGAGDRLLLCSDGLSSMIDAQAISEVLSSERDPQTAADRLVDLANQAGGEDNITVIVVDVVVDEPEDKEEAAPAARTDTDAGPQRRAPSVARRLLKPVLAIAILALLGFAAARYALSNSWYVGVNDDGFVTIYNGIPEEIAGISLSEQDERTDLALDELPEFKRGDVVEGIKVDSKKEAQETVADLEELAVDPEFGGGQEGGGPAPKWRKDRSP
jgi:serine/threonine protein phosphatase PrpC